MADSKRLWLGRTAHFLAFWSVLGGSAHGNLPPPAPLDPTEGEIGGRVAMAVAPAIPGKGGLDAVAPWGMETRLVRLDDPDVELAYPCGSWFQPPPGRYRLRVEGGWLISPYSVVVGYAGRPFRGRGLVVTVPVAGAGRVTLPKGSPPGSQMSLRLLHAGAYLEGEFPRWEVSRRRPSREVGGGLLMPAGRTIAALWDDQSQSYAALSRPFEVKVRQTVAAPLERPQGVAHFVAQLQRPRLARTVLESEAAVHLKSEGRSLPPDLKVSMADRIYAVWYGLPPGRAELQVESKLAFLGPTPLDLRSGRIERLVERLKPLPVLDLDLKKK